MGLSKGRTNNPGGRRLGSKNKVTIPIREQLNDYLKNNFKEFEEACRVLEPRDFVNVFRDLLKYAVPVPHGEPIKESSEESNSLLTIVNAQLEALNNQKDNSRKKERIGLTG